MANTNTGGAAFPSQPIMKMPNGVELTVEQNGMTLRDYFAAKVLQGIMANSYIASVEGLATKLDSINAKSCYVMADAMLEARKA